MTLFDILRVAIPATLSIALLVWGVVAFRRTGSQVTVSFSIGKVDEQGILVIQAPISDRAVTRLAPASEDDSPSKSHGEIERNADESEPADYTAVNVLTIYNKGRTGVSLHRCTYRGQLGTASFQFEPQAAASPFGDRLPKRLEPGEACTLIHTFPAMYEFLERVMYDHGVSSSTWIIFLTLGNGKKKYANGGLQIEAGGDSGSTEDFTITRQVLHDWP